MNVIPPATNPSKEGHVENERHEGEREAEEYLTSLEYALEALFGVLETFVGGVHGGFVIGCLVREAAAIICDGRLPQHRLD